MKRITAEQAEAEPLRDRLFSAAAPNVVGAAHTLGIGGTEVCSPQKAGIARSAHQKYAGACSADLPDFCSTNSAALAMDSNCFCNECSKLIMIR